MDEKDESMEMSVEGPQTVDGPINVEPEPEPQEQEQEQELVASGDGEVPEVFKLITEEVNSRFPNPDDRIAVGNWMNQVIEHTQQAVLESIGPVMGVPLDSEFVPVVPGDVLRYKEGQEVTALAIDNKGNVYYDMGGGAIPSSVAKTEQFTHVRRELTPKECLSWFEESIGTARDDAEHDAIYERCIEMMREAFELEG